MVISRSARAALRTWGAAGFLILTGQAGAGGGAQPLVGCPNKPVALSVSLSSGGVLCRPAPLALTRGAVQNYHCADGVSVAVVGSLRAVSITSFRRGQRPDLTGLLPQVTSASGEVYQNSEWSWRTEGRQGKLELHGKSVAQGCRLQVAAP